jgi:molybdopterin-binding protein
MAQAAELLGVSTDTLRRWADAGRVETTRTAGGRRVVDGAALAELARTLAVEPAAGAIVSASARNRFTGIVTNVVKDTVMAQVELQAGPHRIVALLSREAADELGLAPGTLAVAAIKATNVVVELPVQP